MGTRVPPAHGGTLQGEPTKQEAEGLAHYRAGTDTARTVEELSHDLEYRG